VRHQSIPFARGRANARWKFQAAAPCLLKAFSGAPPGVRINTAHRKRPRHAVLDEDCPKNEFCHALGHTPNHSRHVRVTKMARAA
jgi:hypothetical protein